jgi:hypothetical protein
MGLLIDGCLDKLDRAAHRWQFAGNILSQADDFHAYLADTLIHRPPRGLLRGGGEGHRRPVASGRPLPSHRGSKDTSHVLQAESLSIYQPSASVAANQRSRGSRLQWIPARLRLSHFGRWMMIQGTSEGRRVRLGGRPED